MSSRSSNKRRRLLPREHGAWAELAFPLASALLLGRLTSASILLTVATVALFLAHEPVLVWQGLRGTRARREHGARALRWALRLGAVALLLGLAGLWLAPGEARVAAALPLVLGGALAVFVVRGAEKTLGGELVAALALTGPALPVGLANGLSGATAWANVGVWAGVAALATVAVRAVTAAGRARQPDARRSAQRVRAAALALGVVSLAGIVAAALIGLVPTWAAAGLGPAALFTVAVAYRLPHPSQLKRLGIALVVVQSWTLAAIGLGLGVFG